jgi:hypothetical protein
VPLGQRAAGPATESRPPNPVCVYPADRTRREGVPPEQPLHLPEPRDDQLRAVAALLRRAERALGGGTPFFRITHHAGACVPGR